MSEPGLNALITLKLNEISTKVDNIESKLDDLPCKVNTYKIGLTQKIVFGAIGLILLAFMAQLITHNNKPTVAQAQPQVMQNVK